MALATLLPQIRTDEIAPVKQARLIGFSTTAALLANCAETLHSQRWLMKQASFAQNAPKPEFEAMDPR
jgi:hypothetical protein